jgi:hypothetical protein
MPRPLYPQGKSPWYPLDKRLGGPQSRSGCGGEEENCFIIFKTSINGVCVVTSTGVRYDIYLWNETVRNEDIASREFQKTAKMSS